LELQVRRLVKQYGPEMGDLYYQRSVSWAGLTARTDTARATDKKAADGKLDDKADEKSNGTPEVRPLETTP
jgi:hypothetical protein